MHSNIIKKVKKVIKEEVEKKLKEINDDLPRGEEDPADEESYPIEVHSYNDVSDKGEIEIFFTHFYPLRADYDDLVSFYEKRTKKQLPQDIDAEEAISKVMKKTDFKKFLQDYAIENSQELEIADDNNDSLNEKNNKEFDKEEVKVEKDKDGNLIHIIPIHAKSIDELIEKSQNDEELENYLYSEVGSPDLVKTSNEEMFAGSDIMDSLK